MHFLVTLFGAICLAYAIKAWDDSELDRVDRDWGTDWYDDLDLRIDPSYTEEG